MNAEKIADPNLVQKVKRTKKKKHKEGIPKKFNKEGFILAWGLAIVFAVIGIDIIWSIKITPESAAESTLHHTTQRLIGFFPESFKDTIVFILGSLFIFSAVFLIFLGLKIVVRYIAGKKPKYRRLVKSDFYKSGFRKLLSNKTSISK